MSDEHNYTTGLTEFHADTHHLARIIVRVRELDNLLGTLTTLDAWEERMLGRRAGEIAGLVAEMGTHPPDDYFHNATMAAAAEVLNAVAYLTGMDNLVIGRLAEQLR